MQSNAKAWTLVVKSSAPIDWRLQGLLHPSQGREPGSKRRGPQGAILQSRPTTGLHHYLPSTIDSMRSPFTTMNRRARQEGLTQTLAGAYPRTNLLKSRQETGSRSLMINKAERRLSGVTGCTLGVPKATSGPDSDSAQRLRKPRNAASVPDSGSVIIKHRNCTPAKKAEPGALR